MTTTMTVSTDDLATLLRMWRAAADLKIDELADRASRLLPPSRAIGHETLRRYLKGEFPKSGAPADQVAALAVATGHLIGDLPPELRSDVDLLASLLRKPCFPLSGLVAA